MVSHQGCLSSVRSTRVTCHYHHHHHQFLNREGRWGTTDDFHAIQKLYCPFKNNVKDGNFLLYTLDCPAKKIKKDCKHYNKKWITTSITQPVFPHCTSLTSLASKTLCIGMDPLLDVVLSYALSNSMKAHQACSVNPTLLNEFKETLFANNACAEVDMVQIDTMT